MLRSDAINLIKKIQVGELNTAKINIPMGSIAKNLHISDPNFSLGIEYGVIHGLMISFEINSDEL